ncbi:nucleotidyltransferase [Ligilactobacillus equi]|nr:nucleotidyltransferase [Ligilactobacillus sp.]
MSKVKPEIVGIIAEYNPFHNGHLYQLQQVKERFPGAKIVVAMSGNFLQRGEPAAFDKWTRATQALANGADVVLELPVADALQPADRFAFGGVRALAAFGAEVLAFGAEHATYDFMAYARLTQNLTGNFKKYDQAYAASWQEAIAQKIGHEVSSPNDLLGLAYAKANLALGEPLSLYPIRRIKAAYHEEDLYKDQVIASATAIRQAYLAGKLTDLQAYVPKSTFVDLQSQKMLSWADFWPLLRYRLTMARIEDLGQIYGMAEGIEYRLVQQLEQLGPQATFEEWLKAVKNKRFTYTRLSRLATAVLLDLRTEEVQVYQKAPFLRLLGFSQAGQTLLNKVKKNTPYPLVTRVTQKDKQTFLATDYKVGRIYQLLNGRQQDIKRQVIRF